MGIQTSIIARDAELAALADLAKGGRLMIYSDPRPVGPESAATGTLLANLGLGSFDRPQQGVLRVKSIEPDANSKGSGRASWFRVTAKDGKTALWDGSVGTSDADLIFSNVQFYQGSIVRVESFTYSLPR